jgi:Amt family ammonium transporter
MHRDTGNIAFMLVSTSLVMLMTPGLAFFYGGRVGHKNVLTIMLHSFVSMGVTTALCVVCGFSMAFSGSYQSATTNPDIAGIIGKRRGPILAVHQRGLR